MRAWHSGLASAPLCASATAAPLAAVPLTAAACLALGALYRDDTDRHRLP